MDCVDSSMVKENEVLQQELFDLKKSFERMKLMKSYLELEVEKLEVKLKSVQDEFEEEKSEITRTWVSRLSQVESAINEERGQLHVEYEELQKKYEELALKDKQAQPELILDQTNSQYQVEIDELKMELFNKKEDISKLKFSTIQMTEKNNELQKELEEIKESLKCKSESLMATLHALEEMKDEKALLTTELVVLKAGPVENKERGNSLFGEIEDKRACLETKLNLLYRKYMELKRSLALKESELNHVKRENIKTKLQFKEGEEQLKAKENSLVYKQKRTIEELTEKISRLESSVQESPQFVTLGTSNLEWVHIIVEKARSEARDLRKALEQRSLGSLFHDQEKFALESEILFLKKQLFMSTTEIENLNLKLANKENSSIDSSSIANEDPEMKEPRKKLTFASDVKENDGVPLKKLNKKPFREMQINELVKDELSTS